MHTKKTNNTNKLIQISYHSVLTKIQKLQNLKKKKKKFLYWPVLPEIGQYGRYEAGVRLVFFPVRNRGVECTGLLAGTVYSDRYGTKLITLFSLHQTLIQSNSIYIPNNFHIANLLLKLRLVCTFVFGASASGIFFIFFFTCASYTIHAT